MTDEDKFYHSAAWRKKRKDILRRDNFECQRCRRRIEEANRDGITLEAAKRKISRAVCVHHIKEYKDRPDLALIDDNLISLCGNCHNDIHGRTAGEKLRYTKRIRITNEKW